jgi:hypothetical protein
VAGEPRAYVAISRGMEHEVCDKTLAGWLDRITGELNGWLFAVAIGLGMLDLTVRRQRHAASALAASCYPRSSSHAACCETVRIPNSEL